MTLRTRIELEAHFKNGRRPAQSEFADLIASQLNKRDDQFHGRWRPGTRYRTGDMVIYERALWEVADDGAGGDRELCSETPPDEDLADSGGAWRTVLIPSHVYGCYVDTDESKMDDVQSLDPVLDRLKGLHPVTFVWNTATGLEGEGTQLGLVAQEVDAAFAEAVKTNQDQTKAVSYHALVPVLVKAVQEQQDVIEDLNGRLAALEERFDALETEP